MIARALLASAVLALAACADERQNPDGTAASPPIIRQTVTRAVDDTVRGVSCWVTANAISCVKVRP